MGAAEVIMGRKPTVNLNLPPHMRKRVQRSGKVYYYLRTGAPRKEIPLGPDFILALKKYTELHAIDAPRRDVVFSDVILKYRAESLPKLGKATIATQTSDIKHIEAFFKDAPLDQIEPMHINEFLNKHRNMPTTANRCKRLVSTMWNQARGWGYTSLPNPCAGIKGYNLGQREVYVTDTVMKAVWDAGTEPLRDALDLAYLSGQRPSDALKTSEHDVQEGFLFVRQGKVKGKKLRIAIIGELAALLDRIRTRKNGYKIHHTSLLVNLQGGALTKAVLRNHFEAAREAAAIQHPELADEIRAMWFYDLRAKAADDTADDRGEQEASNLLGHESVRTTQRHYLRRGRKVKPTK